MDFSSLSEQSLRTSRRYLRAESSLMIRTGHVGAKSPLERAEGSPQAWIQWLLPARRFVNQTANCETALMSGRAGDKRIVCFLPTTAE